MPVEGPCRALGPARAVDVPEADDPLLAEDPLLTAGPDRDHREDADRDSPGEHGDPDDYVHPDHDCRPSRAAAARSPVPARQRPGGLPRLSGTAAKAFAAEAAETGTGPGSPCGRCLEPAFVFMA